MTFGIKFLETKVYEAIARTAADVYAHRLMFNDERMKLEGYNGVIQS